MKHWLLKSEGVCYSIDDLKKDRETAWGGVRNYQARNFLKEMKKGDRILFYHSSGKLNGVYGLAKVTQESKPDETQFDKKDEHYDPKATRDNPLWFCPKIAFVSKFAEPISLSEIKRDPKLVGMGVTRRGDRLSVQPVSEAHFEYVLSVAKKG